MYTVQTTHGYTIAWTHNEAWADTIAEAITRQNIGTALFVCPVEDAVKVFTQWTTHCGSSFTSQTSAYDHYYYEGQRISKKDW